MTRHWYHMNPLWWYHMNPLFTTLPIFWCVMKPYTTLLMITNLVLHVWMQPRLPRSVHECSMYASQNKVRYCTVHNNATPLMNSVISRLLYTLICIVVLTCHATLYSQCCCTYLTRTCHIVFRRDILCMFAKPIEKNNLWGPTEKNF